MGFLRYFLGVPLVVCLCIANISVAVSDEVETLPVESVEIKEETKTAEESGPTAQELLGLVDGDRFLGNKNAPVVMVEYASFACSHCADFAVKVFPKLKRDYIDQGKLLYVLRDFPLDKLSLTAAMLGSCYRDNKAFFAYAKAVFNSFDALIATHKDLGLLANIARISNISDEEFKRCTTDEALMDQVVQQKFLAVSKLDVNATPAFFINGRRYEGARDYNSMAEEIERTILLNPNYTVLSQKGG
ncbi:MAG: DsbA family protein [Anaplasma sp.]